MSISLLFPVVVINVNLIFVFENKIYNCICIDTRNIYSVVPYKLKAENFRDHADCSTKYMLTSAFWVKIISS